VEHELRQITGDAAILLALTLTKAPLLNAPEFFVPGNISGKFMNPVNQWPLTRISTTVASEILLNTVRTQMQMQSNGIVELESVEFHDQNIEVEEDWARLNSQVNRLGPVFKIEN